MPFPTSTITEFTIVFVAFMLLSIAIWLGPVSCLRQVLLRIITRLVIAPLAVWLIMSRDQPARTKRSRSERCYVCWILTPVALLLAPLLIGGLLLLGVLLIYPLQALAGLALLFAVLRG